MIIPIGPPIDKSDSNRNQLEHSAALTIYIYGGGTICLSCAMRNRQTE